MTTSRSPERAAPSPPQGLALARPAAATALVAALVLAAMAVSDPVQVVVVLAAVVYVLQRSGKLRAAAVYLRVGLYAGAFLLVINPLLVPGGLHVLWKAALGPIDLSITGEGLVFGVSQFLRLVTLVMAFSLYSVGLEPDDQLALMSRFSFRSGLVVSLATRLFPILSRDAKSIAEAQRCRGIELDLGNRRQRIAARMPLLSALVVRSLERACDVAGAMEVRGYGRGRRSTWTRDSRWRPFDRALVSLALTMLVVLVAGLVRGGFSYQFFPRLDSLSRSLLSPWWITLAGLLALMVTTFSLPTVARWVPWLR